MAKPNPYELELIQKITRATTLLEGSKRQHSDTCPTVDPHIAGKCTCGADKVNNAIEKVLEELDL